MSGKDRRVLHPTGVSIYLTYIATARYIVSVRGESIGVASQMNHRTWVAKRAGLPDIHAGTLRDVAIAMATRKFSQGVDHD